MILVGFEIPSVVKMIVGVHKFYAPWWIGGLLFVPMEKNLCSRVKRPSYL